MAWQHWLAGVPVLVAPAFAAPLLQGQYAWRRKHKHTSHAGRSRRRGGQVLSPTRSVRFGKNAAQRRSRNPSFLKTCTAWACGSTGRGQASATPQAWERNPNYAPTETC